MAILLTVVPFFAGQQAYAKWLDRYENIQPSGKPSVPKYNIRNGSIDVSSGNTLMGFNEDGSELSSEAWPNVAYGENGITSY